MRVYGCDAAGPLSQVLFGFDWILKQMAFRPSHRAVINLSFATDHLALLDESVAALTSAGAIVIVAAGNTAGDACQTSPASASLTSPGIITVGSSDSGDTFSEFSDYGKCVSVVAPGRAIISLGYDSDVALAAMSGTSMASPHVTGVVALILQAYPNATLAQVRAMLECTATQGVLTSLPNQTPDMLLYSSPRGFLQRCVPAGDIGEAAVPSASPAGSSSGTTSQPSTIPSATTGGQQATEGGESSVPQPSHQVQAVASPSPHAGTWSGTGTVGKNVQGYQASGADGWTISVIVSVMALGIIPPGGLLLWR